MIELSTEDRERIEQVKNEVALKNGWNDWDSLVIWHCESGLMSELWEYIDEVAEYAIRYEREQQAKRLESLGNYSTDKWAEIINLEQQIAKLEAERSELIRGIKSILKASTVHDKISILEELEQLLNSLKK